jgi:hypothetical protein
MDVIVVIYLMCFVLDQYKTDAEALWYTFGPI